MKKNILTLLCVTAIIIIISYPKIIADGVREGIRLNLYSVIPSLLPFMVLTNIMLKYNLCETVSFFLKPVLSRLFKVSSTGCFAVIIGFTCGYPMGAKIVGDLYQNKALSKSEACYLISFCNNCSISFLLNYILYECLNNTISLSQILLFIYLPPVLTGIINGFLLKPDCCADNFKYCADKSNSDHKNNLALNYNIKNNSNPDFAAKSSLSVSSPVLNAAKTMSILSVYIICFTVISNRIASLTFLPDTLKSVIACFTEVTSGTHFAVSSLKGTYCTFFVLTSVVFGGLSIMFQSFEQLPDKSLKKSYIIGKLEQTCIFFVLFLLTFSI